jgi:thiamine biosynthesis lipoprotein
MDPSFFRVEFKAMGSHCEIVIACNSESLAYQFFNSCIEEIKRFEKKYSRYLEDSFLSEINRNAHQQWIECDDETVELLTYADFLFEISEGLFDITSGIYRKCWDFSKPIIPEKARLEDIQKFVGWEKVLRKDNSIRFEISGMEIDFGGFGKEYAVDKIANFLMSKGVKSGFVNFGGDLRVLGPKVDGQPWVMAILDPNNPDQSIASIPIKQGALATSGNYEKYFDLDGIRYCHVINPKTGMPVNYWKSISVLGVNATQSGTYTTIAMLKEDKALQWLISENISFLAIDLNDEQFKEAA